MILIDNINILRANNPATWEVLRPYEEEENRVLFKVEETRKGDKTLAFIKDEKTIYLHSRYNPLKEAETIMESYKDINEETSIIFYGTGLGYHIKFILEKYPNVKYYIYEPIPELMYHCLSHINLKEFQMKRLIGMNIGIGGENSLSRFVDLNKDNLILVELPSHKQSFPEEYKGFNEMFLNIVKGKRRGIATDYSFQKRWIINSMKNFGEVLSTPNILLEKKGQFKDKPAILVAAGPSLNEEIENLKYIKENGLAYIFSVGSAINTLLHHGIYPHAACTYDPTAHNQKVFDRVRNEKITEIPLIFGTSGVFETVMNYPGQKYHMITSQDTISNYYLKGANENILDIVRDAPSIAVVTLQLLYKLGFGPILLVGQNLAYRGRERHSVGISYSREVTDEEQKKGIWIKDVNGNEILTNETFDSMRKQMEYYIKEFPNIEIINTTQGGAHIEGTKFVELKELIEKNLKEKVVDEKWLEGNKQNYSKEYLINQSKKMDEAYDQVLKTIKEYYSMLDRIDRLINNRNFNQVEKMYVKTDAQLRKIEQNDYYKVFILPMNRVHHKMLADSIESLKGEKDPYQRGKKNIESFKRFIDICSVDMEMIEPIYEEVKQAIESYGDKIQ